MHKNHNGPYHLINTTLNVSKSEKDYLQGRGGDNFIFSKYFCGSKSTGYRATGEYEDGDTRLATVMAVSGAAISPQMGKNSTSRILTFLMTLLNIRLNRWMPNPKRKKGKTTCRPYYFLKELFSYCSEDDNLLNLSDGGHFENLGVYPLIKRRCKYIIASDAGCDPHYIMNDLANLFRKIRIDFGVDIKIDLSGLYQTDKKLTSHHYAIGKIRYPGCEKDDSLEGYFLYFKTTLTGEEPEDLINYRKQNKDFPDETTSDQFFDEGQFESYRKLGEFTGKEVFDNYFDLSKSKDTITEDHLKKIFRSLYDRYQDSIAKNSTSKDQGPEDSENPVDSVNLIITAEDESL